MELRFSVSRFKKIDKVTGLRSHKYKGMLVYRRRVGSSDEMKALQDDMLHRPAEIQWNNIGRDEAEARPAISDREVNEALAEGQNQNQQKEGGRLEDVPAGAAPHELTRRRRLDLLQTMGPPAQIHPLEVEYEGGAHDMSQNQLLAKPGRGKPTHDADEVNPFHFVQHPNLLPRSRGEKVKDARVLTAFRAGVAWDILALRVISIVGNLAVMALVLREREIQQLIISCVDTILISIIVVMIQAYLSYEKNWEE
jgi:hypothetical protein